MTRYEIFNRDKYTCQYCGEQSRHLTLDHVIPRYRAGQHTWENVVSACVDCNRRKAGRTPKEANMKLIRQPLPPTGNHLFVVPHQYLNKRDEWRKYFYQSLLALSGQPSAISKWIELVVLSDRENLYLESSR